MATSKSQVTLLLTALSVLAFIQIFLISPARPLFEGFGQVKRTGALPDGVSVRRRYTGSDIVDGELIGLAGFFSAISDGRDIATYLFSLWFLPQLCGLLVFVYWEAGKVDRGLVKLPTVFGIMAQLLTVGVTIPWYFMAHMRGVPISPYVVPSDAIARARTLFPAIVIGYLVPSAALFFAPITLDTRQIIAVLWQPFPVYVAGLHMVFRHLYAAVFPAKALSPAAKTNAALISLKRSYILAGALSAVPHWSILIPSLFSSEPSSSFAHIFIPPFLHPYLPYHVERSSIPAFRVAGRLLLQHDWFFMAATCFIFFAWARFTQPRFPGKSASVGLWLARLAIVVALGGPGVAFAMEAVEREERLAQQTLAMKNGSATSTSKEH